MTKVEELRKELNADLGACHLALFRDDKGVTESIDSLISAARAEGVAEGARDKGLQESNFRKVANLLSEANAKLATAKAEGAEQMKAEIRKAGNKVDVFSDGNFLVDDIVAIRRRYAGDNRHACLIPLFVLAPTKEPTVCAVGDSGESGHADSGLSATSTGGHWKQVYVPPPEMTFGPAGAVLAPTKEGEP